MVAQSNRGAHSSGSTVSRKSASHHRRRRHHAPSSIAPVSSSSKHPDLDALRQARASYYAEPNAERLSTSRRITKVSSERTRTHADQRSKSTEQKEKPTKHARRKRTSSDQGYVYQRGDTSRTRSTARTMVNSERERKATARRPNATRAPEASEESAPSHSQEEAPRRPVLHRSNTTTHTHTPGAGLTARPPDNTDTSSILPSKRSSKRSSSLLTSLFRSQSSPSVVVPRLVDCLTCGADDVPSNKSARLECNHRMCHDCLKRIFTMSVTDPGHMPPKCCTSAHIPLRHVDALFSNKFKLHWNKKYAEYTAKDRLYCPRKGCGEWISSVHESKSCPGRKYGRCGKCELKVCAKCNGKWHRSSKCPDDEETRKFIATAKEKGWQKCYNCSAMVELKEGCNHMTCRCTAEFCMLCGSRWKSCDCPWFNYASPMDGDRLGGMRIPQVIEVLRRRIDDPAGVEARMERVGRAVRGQPEVGYQAEMDARRRQERMDEELARRLQFMAFGDPHPVVPGPPDEHQQAPFMDVFGIGNAAAHFLNEDFVRTAAHAVLRAFGEDAAAMGRRGERQSGRRRRQPTENAPVGMGDGGLAPNAFGDASVLGVGPATPRAGRDPERPAASAQQASHGDRRGRIGQWLQQVS